MNRLFGKGKEKAPPPNLNDCVANVDSRAESVDKKVARLDAELRKYKVRLEVFISLNVCIKPLDQGRGLTPRN